MTAPEFGDWEAIWLGVEDTDVSDGWYPVEWDVRFNELSVFEKKVTFGAIDKDSDDIISSYVMADWSGGGQIDLLTGADQTRFRHAILDARKPGAITLPQYVETITPAGATGSTTYPACQIGDYPYVMKGNKVYPWDEDTDSLGSSLTVTADPEGKGTPFNAEVYFPYGTSGYGVLSESAPGTPVWNLYTGVAEPALSTDTDSPTVVDFEVWDNKIWALTTTGVLAYSFTGDNDDWSWDQAWDAARGAFLKLDTARPPKRLITFVDNNGDPCLVVIADGYAYRVDFVAKSYELTSIQFPPHPDFGRAAAIWRPGEDLKIGVGLGMISYTAAGVVDPDTGLSRGDGMPYSNLGAIVDLEPEVSHLYAAVSGSSVDAISYPYSAKVGAAGTGNGQFVNVRGLTVDSTGDIWAADEENERIQRFSSALAYEAQSGSAGTGNGQFASNDGPWDAASDSSNNVFVVDRGNSRVQKFNSSGTYQSQFGSFDDGTPAVGGSSTWTLQDTYGPTFNSLSMNGVGDIGPTQVAVDSTDRVLIVDSANDRVVILLSDGTYSTGITGLSGIGGVCVDSSDNIYVVYDGGGDIGIAKYNSSLTSQWSTTMGGTTALGGAHCTTDGTHLWVTSPLDTKVYKRLCSTGAAVSNFGSSGTGSGQFGTASPYGIAVDGTYLYISDPANNRLQKFAKATGAYVTQWATSDNPRAVALDAAGNVLVGSADADTVTRYTTTGILIDAFSQTNPYGIGVADDDVLWVSNISDGTVAVWDEEVVVESESEPPANGSFNLPQSLAIKTSSGRTYVCDTGNHRVQYFDNAGAYEGKFGSSDYSETTGAITAGSGDGEFTTPVGVDLNQSTGDVYVVDQGNDRIQQFSATGSFILAFGSSGTGNGQFQLPTCIAISPSTQTVFVGDATRCIVQEFSTTGVYLRQFGASGSSDGQFTSISGIAFNAAGDTLYVADDSLERIQSFDLTTSTNAFPAKPSMHYWTGSGWQGAWELDDANQRLTWAQVTATSHATDGYRLWWGCTDGNIYTMPLRRTFHNPRSGWQAGIDRFAESGYLISSRFNALMAGFYKKASRLVVFTDNATPTERIRVQYRIDVETEDAWTDFTDENGDIIYADATGRTVLPFAVDADGFSWGERFEWVQFKFSFERGDDPYQTPVMSAAVLNYTKVPQQAKTFMFTVPFPKSSWNERTGVEIRDGLAALLRADQYVKLVHQDSTYRGQLAAVAGITATGQNYNGGATVNFIEIGVDS
jgi:sugar lactone lactonase YvrE